jgi:hypothetical protein
MEVITVMKIIPYLLAACLTTTLTANARPLIKRVVEETFTVQPGGQLTVETSGGEVKVRPGSDDKVRIVAHQSIRASTDAEAGKFLEKLTFKLEQSGNDVTAFAKYGKRTFGFRSGSWPPVQVSFEITVPSNYNVSVRTSGGSIVIGNLTGEVDLKTSGGDVTVGKIDGEVMAHTSGGDVELEESSKAADLSTSGGDITVGRVLGPAEVSTSGGNIKVGSAEGRLKAHSSGGNISANINGPLIGDCSLDSSGGSVRVTVDRTAAFDLEASTSGGDVDATGLTITIKRGGIGKSRLSGAVNGGGPRLRLHTSGGDVDIKTH